MRFFEFEAREIVKRAGIPVTDYGFTTDPAEAATIAERIGGPTVIKSQVLAGGRMKAGGVKFADTPAEAESYARDILAAGDRRAHAARRARRPEGRGRAGVLRGRRLGRHREEAADAVQRHGRHRHRAGRRGAPRPRRPRPLLHARALLRLPGQAGDRRRRRHRQGPAARHARARAPGPAVPRQRHDARRDQPAGGAEGRLVRRARRAHGDGERGHAAPEGPAQGAGHRRGGGHPRGPHADLVRRGRQGDRRRRSSWRDPGQGHRLQRQHRPRDRRGRRLADAHRRRAPAGRQARQLLRDRRQPVRRQGLRPGQAGPPERRRREDRRDDVDRLQHARGHRRARRDQGLPRARQGPRRDDRDLPHPRRLGGGGLQDPRHATGSSTATARCRCGRPPAARSPRSKGATA